MQAHCSLNEANKVLVDKYFHRLKVVIQHIFTLKNLVKVEEIIQHAIKARKLQIIKPRDLMHLNGFYKRIHLYKILNQVIPRTKFSVSPRVGIGSLAFILNNRGTV